MSGKGRPNRPAGHGPLGHVPHDLAVGAHAIAMERRHHHPALAQVALAVEQEQGVPAEDRLQHDGRLAGAQRVLVAGEDLADGGRVAEHHDRGRRGQADREGIAVALAAAVEVLDRAHDEPQALQHGGQRGAGGE